MSLPKPIKLFLKQLCSCCLIESLSISFTIVALLIDTRLFDGNDSFNKDEKSCPVFRNSTIYQINKQWTLLCN